MTTNSDHLRFCGSGAQQHLTWGFRLEASHRLRPSCRRGCSPLGTQLGEDHSHGCWLETSFLLRGPLHQAVYDTAAGFLVAKEHPRWKPQSFFNLSVEVLSRHLHHSH